MTAATDMVERVARAIARETYGGGVPGVSLDPGEWERCCQAARAAIEAMREPTEGMELAGVEAEGYRSLGLLKVRLVWKSMIGAALGSRP